MIKTLRRALGLFVVLAALSELLANRPAADPFDSDEAIGAHLQFGEARLLAISDTARCRWLAFYGRPSPDNPSVFRCPFP